METKDMKNHGRYMILLSGTQKHYGQSYIARNVYEHNGKYYIRFHGNLIEVRHTQQGYATVDEY